MTRRRMSEKSVDDMVQELADEWGDCYITVRNSDYELGDVTVSNKTDEGLPAGRETRRFEGETLSEAVQKALEEVKEDA